MKFFVISQRWSYPVLVLICLLPAQGAEACSCMAFPDETEKAVATAFAQADVIFLGDVTDLRDTFLGIQQQREVTFSVRDRWKGSTPDTTLVRTNIGEIACGYNFEKGSSYLVFAYWDQQQESLTTSFCELNRTEAEARDAIAALDRLKKQSLRSPE